MKTSFSLILTFIILLSAGALAQSNDNQRAYKLFFLGGQSNMDGFGYNSELPDSLNKSLNNVWIFQRNPVADDQENGGLGLW